MPRKKRLDDQDELEALQLLSQPQSVAIPQTMPEQGQVSLIEFLDRDAASLDATRPEHSGETLSANVMDMIQGIGGPTTQTGESSATSPTQETNPMTTPNTETNPGNDLAKDLIKDTNLDGVFTLVDPQNRDALCAFAAIHGCTANGIARFADAILSEHFRSRQIKVLNLTPELDARGYLIMLQGSVLHRESKTKTNPNPKARAGFTFDPKAAQKAFYVRGVTHSELGKKDGKPIQDARGRTRGDVAAQYLVLPETTPGATTRPEPGSAMGTKLPGYNPIIRLMSHIIDDDGKREEWYQSSGSIQGAASTDVGVKLAREFRTDLPAFIFDILFDLGQTDDDLLVTHTTYEQIALNGQTGRNAYRDRGPVVTAMNQSAATPQSSNANSALLDAVARLAG